MSKVNPIQLQKFLKGTDYPADKKALLKQAEKNGAEKDMTEILNQLPEQEYQTPAEVSKEVGKLQ